MRVYEKNIYVEFVKKINIQLVGYHSKKVEKNWPKRVQIIDMMIITRPIILVQDHKERPQIFLWNIFKKRRFLSYNNLADTG